MPAARSILALAALLTVPSAADGQRLTGRTVDENGRPAPHAVVTLRSAQGPGDEKQAIADAAGRFELRADSTGRFLLSAHRDGFFSSEDLSLALGPGETEATVTLQHVREERQSVDVTAADPDVDLQETAQVRTVRNEEVVSIPYPSTHSLENALRLLPGATVQDRNGNLHFNGGSAQQTYWTLDGFNVADPLTGRLQAPLNVEAVRSAALSSGPYSAEHGKGSAGAMAIQTEMGSDRFRYTATNFAPGLELDNGLRLGDFRPRVKASGPIRAGRAWFATSFDAEYSPTIVDELPPGENRFEVYRLSNLSRVQWNLTDSNILQGGALVSGSENRFEGLAALDPIETTRDTRFRQHFFHVKDQHYWRSGLLVEGGYAHNRTYQRETPQGSQPLRFTPFGRAGNWFVRGGRWTRRDQAIASALLPAFRWAGEHRVKTGFDLNGLEYRQDLRRTGFERRGAEGELLRRVTFGGSGRFAQTNFEAAWYVQDSWRPARGTRVELGLRRDWDRLVGRWSTSPRASFAWSPDEEGKVKISGGFAVVHDATPLAVFGRGLDQFRWTQSFNPESGELGERRATLFVIDRERFRSPQSRTWSLGVEKLFGDDLLLKAGWLRRRGRRGFTFIRQPDGDPPAALPPEGPPPEQVETVRALRNAGKDRFDSVEVTVRKDFSGSDAVLVSYARSSSRSNAALDISVETPNLVYDNFGPTPWDAPNRLLSWGRWAFHRKWAAAYMLEWRSGFPFSIETEEGAVVGGVNAQRFPDFLELNVSLERTFGLLGRLWALRLSVINAADRRNPTVVNNVVGSPDFLQFAGGTSRAFVARIRWLGTR